ncbi:TerC family protein [Herpetosiphon llansteffanensis]|uniref:TerC family protein n=1 Tax=Herpetosiphon llansteffanensis TaxID=2094568 RepID=UPI000D7BAE77|nr:TerC family protein [Herpetosiphon llansteffanensis]
MDIGIWPWVGFTVFVFAMLALDLGVFHRNSHEVSVKEAAIWSVVWISLALSFNVGLYFWKGGDIALKFLTGYLIEKSLSVDNIFVFVLIFSYFQVPAKYQHRVLFWGVFGALVMRAILIFVGAALIERFEWIIYIFGAFLIYTGINMARQGETHIDPDTNPVVKFVRKILPVSSQYNEDHFFTRNAGKLMATPLFLVLVLVEASDLIFAVDSIPAIFAVTTDTFLVYTSNVFAILGLRSLYFVLAGVVDKFYYLKYGLAVILTFVGVKMLVIALGIHVPTYISLGVIIGVLVISVIASLRRAKRLEGVDTPLDNPVTNQPVIKPDNQI